MWHLHFMLEKKKVGGGGELAHLGTSSPVSSAAILVVVGASDVALPHCRWWVFFVICGCSGGHWGE